MALHVGRPLVPRTLRGGLRGAPRSPGALRGLGGLGCAPGWADGTMWPRGATVLDQGACLRSMNSSGIPIGWRWAESSRLHLDEAGVSAGVSARVGVRVGARGECEGQGCGWA